MSSEPCCLTSITKKLKLTLFGLCGIVYHFKCNANSSVPCNASSWRLYVGSVLTPCAPCMTCCCCSSYSTCTACTACTAPTPACTQLPWLADPWPCLPRPVQCAARALMELRGLAAEKGTRDTAGKLAKYNSLVNKTAGQEHCRPRRTER